LCLLLRTLLLWLLLGRLLSPLRGLLLSRLLDPLLLWLLLLRLLSLLLRRRLWLSRLLGPLLLWLLIGLSAPLLGFVLMPACLRLFRPTLRTLLLRGRRRSLLLPTLLLFGLSLFFILLVMLRERRDHRSEKQKQGSSRNSNDLHGNQLP
jgi:hypothetical protein